MNGSKLRVPVIAALVLGIATAGLAGTLIVRQVKGARSAGDIAEQKKLLADLKQQAVDCRNTTKDYGALCLKLGGRLPQCTWSDQMPFMVGQLTGIAESNGLKIETLQPQPMTESKPVRRFPLRIGVQAGLPKLVHVLEDLETTVPLLKIERLDVRTGQNTDGMLKADMTVSSFVVLDKNAKIAKRRATPKPPKRANEPEKMAEKPRETKKSPKPPKPAPSPTPPAAQAPGPTPPVQPQMQTKNAATVAVENGGEKPNGKLRRKRRKQLNADQQTQPAAPGEVSPESPPESAPAPDGGAR